MFDQLFVTETPEQEAVRKAAEAAEARIKAAEEAREAARIEREEAEARVKAAAEAEELRVTVLYGKWLSKFVRDDAFDEAAYDRTVAIAVREKEAADNVRRAEAAAAAAERERAEKERAEELRLEVPALTLTLTVTLTLTLTLPLSLTLTLTLTLTRTVGALWAVD
jgi:hypothetical protein